MKTRLAVLALVLVAAYALKRFYSVAGADELDWILRPTTALVEAATGYSFVREQGAGYENRDLMFVIAPSCAGVNFLIAAFVMLSFTLVPRRGGWAALWAAGAAFGTTVVVNATRIVLVLAVHREGATYGWLTPDRLHRLIGAAVYLVALCALYRIARGRGGLGRPIAWYLAFALLVPLANGAAARPGFAEHAIGVLAVAIAAWLLVRYLPRREAGVPRVAGDAARE